MIYNFGLLIVFGIFCWLQVQAHRLRRKAIAYGWQQIEAAFKAQVARLPCLATAYLVRKKDVRKSDSGWVETDRIYRCMDGTYWLFICSNSSPGYLTQLSPERVRNALRSTPEILVKEFPDAA